MKIAFGLAFLALLGLCFLIVWRNLCLRNKKRPMPPRYGQATLTSKETLINPPREPQINGNIRFDKDAWRRVNEVLDDED